MSTIQEEADANAMNQLTDICRSLDSVQEAVKTLAKIESHKGTDEYSPDDARWENDTITQLLEEANNTRKLLPSRLADSVKTMTKSNVDEVKAKVDNLMVEEAKRNATSNASNAA